MKDLSPLISVIVPVYNVAQYLPQCLDSILAQTYCNLEIILVNDGSTDNSGKICDEYAAKDERIRVIHKENGGVSAARNTGIDAARGEYLGFVDSDDYAETNMYECALNALQEHDADIVCFNAMRVNERGKHIEKTEHIKAGLLSTEDALKELIAGNINSYYANKLYKRSLFSVLRCPGGRVWEDLATCYLLFMNAKRIYLLPEVFYFYRNRAGSITNSLDEKALCDVFTAKLERYHCLEELYPDIARSAVMNVSKSALRIYDRSLYADIPQKTLVVAKDFLRSKRTEVLTWRRLDFQCYFRCNFLYNTLRRFKHKVGSLLKKLC